MDLNTIRKITIQGEGQQSLDTLASSLNKVATASGGVATVTDMATKRSLSAADAYKRQTLAVVDGARAQDQLARSIRVADAALAQGRINTTQHAERIGVLQQKYGQASEATKVLTAATGGLSRAFSVASGALGAFGVALGVGALVAYGKAVFSTTADLQEQADQVLGAGGNVEAFQALHGVFLTNGISMEAGDKILAKLTRSLGEAEGGAKKAQDAFHSMGLGAKELAGTTADAALPLVAKKLLEIEDATKRAALETAIFGKTGQQLESALSALASGSMSDLIARAKELGIVIDKEMIEKADKAKDQMALSWMKLSVALAPIIINWVQAFSDFTTSINGSKSALNETIDSLKTWAALGGGAWLGSKIPGPLPVKIGGAIVGAGAAYVATHLGQDTFANHLGDADMGIVTPGAPTFMAASPYHIGGVASVPPSATRGSRSIWAPTAEDIANAKKIEDSRNHVKSTDAEITKSAEEIAKSGIKQLETQIKYLQHQDQVATATDQYIVDLQKEVEFAGMSTDEREKQQAILEGMRVSEKGLNDAQKATIVATVGARQEAERWRQVVDDISGGFKGFFEDVLNNGKLSFSSLWDSIKQSFVRMLAYMATQALINPIIVPMVGGIQNALGIGGSAGSNPLGLLSSFSSLWGGSSAAAGNWAGSIMDDGTILGGGSAASGGGLFSNIGNLFGGGGSILGGSGSLLSRLVPGAAIAMASSMLGTAIFGNKNDTGLGGALFGLPGAFLGSLTGSSNNGAISNFTNGGLGNTLFKAGGGQNGQMATQASGTINKALQALKDAGVDVSLGNVSGLSIGSDKSYVYDFAGGKQKLAGGQEGVQATVNAILDRILPSASSGDSAVNDLLQKYGGLNSGNLGAFSTELQAISNKKAQDAADAATAATKALADQFGTLGGDLKGFASNLQDSAKAARDAADNWQKAKDNLDKARTALLISAPGLSPTEQYSNSRSQFDSLLNSARGGSSQSANDLSSFASQFLQTSFQYNGSTSAYGSDLSYVKDTLGGLSDFSEAQRSYAQRQADSLDAAVAQLSSIYDAISNAANQNNEGLAELRAELNELSQSIKDGNLQARMVS